jgi:hypothetical protein
MKHFALSKLNWVGAITALIGVLGLMNQLNLSEQTMKIVMFTVGVLTIVLRTFFTSGPVSIEKPEGEMGRM